MSEAQAKWSADGSFIPSLDPHTKAKHLILEKYIENLVYTLYAKTRRGETRFTFIDGFCGGGIYKDKDTRQEWEGSPTRIIKSVREAHRKSKRTYPEPLNIKYIFIDGYGFKTANYYNQNQMELELNITKDRYNICMNKLDRDVGKLIFQSPDGIYFQEIRHKTMPLNPANKRLYNEYLNRYINEKELEVWRNGKLLRSKKIEFRKNDIIKVVKKYQISLFYKSKFFKDDLQ